jgi:hypothetical protein
MEQDREHQGGASVHEGDDEVVDVVANGSGDSSAISPLDQLKQQYDEVQESRGHTADIDVPGYDGLLVAHYRLMTTKEVERLAKQFNKIKSISERNLLTASTILAAACEGISLTVNGEDQPLHEIKEYDTPVRFDSRLAETFGFEAKKSFDVMMAVFPTEWSIIDQYRKLSRWMSDTTKGDFEDFLV